MNMLLLTIILPAIAGFMVYLIPSRFPIIIKFISMSTTLASGIITGMIVFGGVKIVPEYFNLDALSGMIALFIGFFGILVVLYSLKYVLIITQEINRYFAYILLTISASYGVAFANHMILLFVFWGFLGLTLYLLISFGKDAVSAAHKAFIIILGSDSLMLMGMAIIHQSVNSWTITDINIPLSGAGIWPMCAFFSFVIAALAKAGAMPFHTWIPDAAEKGPIPVTAFLPASLDKLLGIYLLARICLYMFELTSGLVIMLSLIGSVTIVAAVFMAMIQHDLRKLLSYHAVSQVGYMVLGISLGTPLAVTGGLFHLINNAIYKSGLFFTSGAVKYNTGTMDMDRLGGLGKYMPWTFAGAVIASLSISGIPPLNGFFSKWMIYQGLIDYGRDGGFLWVIWLPAALIGSALTLASFMKVIFSVYMGRPDRKWAFREVSWTMTLPVTILSVLCILFGIFAISGPLQYLVFPVTGTPEFEGFWNPTPATTLILFGVLLGIILYLLGNTKKIRRVEVFTGGESIPDRYRVTGTGFYDTVKEMRFFKPIYRMASEGYFDIYVVGKRFAFSVTRNLQIFHHGNLVGYLCWLFIGIMIIILIMWKGV